MKLLSPFCRSSLLCFVTCALWVCAANDLRAHNTLRAQNENSNDLTQIIERGFIASWFVTTDLPSELDAGTYENFQRFNIERLPLVAWFEVDNFANLNPRAGAAQTVKGSIATSATQATTRRADVPEVAAEQAAQQATQSNIKTANITWHAVKLDSSSLDFFSLNNKLHKANQVAQPIGTAYAVARLEAARNESVFIETDNFLGAIYLNGTSIYNGYQLNAARVVRADFKLGGNTLVVRATGITGDYFRKNGGWTANLKLTRERPARDSFYPRAGIGANTGKVFYLEGFHVDPVYLHDQRRYARITLSNTNQYINSLRADNLYGVFLSEIDYLKPYLDTRPEDRELVRRAVRENRVGTGGSYNQFNELTIGGESMIRNILYGRLMHKAMIGDEARALALWDVFGHAPQISQIARKSGFDGIVWSKKITGFPSFFFDYALDGSRLLHRRVDYAYSFSGFGSGKNYSLDAFKRLTARKFDEARSLNSNTDLRINAADFTPPWTNLAGSVEDLKNNRPSIITSGKASEFYFDNLKKEIETGQVNVPVTSRDKVFFHVGVSAARSDLKVAHRLAENMTLAAERFSAVAYFFGAPYPDRALDKAWRHILFGSHHDAITGTPSDNALLDLIHGYRESYELSRDALRDSLNRLAAQINTQPTNITQAKDVRVKPLVVFNPLSWSRTDYVRAQVNTVSDNIELRDNHHALIAFKLIDKNDGDNSQKGARLIEFIAREVPSVGYRTFYVIERNANKSKINNRQPSDSTFNQSHANQNVNQIENEFYRITIDPARGGAITSLYDKQARREVINTANNQLGNEVAALAEELTKKNVIYPAWEFWTTGERKFSTTNPARVGRETGGEIERLIIETAMPNMRALRQTITVAKGIKRIDFQTELAGYTGKDELFVVNFPLNLTGGALVTEDRFGVVTRNASKGFLDFRSNTDKLVSGAPVYSAQNFVEYGETLSLRFKDSQRNATRASVVLRPAALIRNHDAASEAASEKIVAALIKRGVSVTPFYDDNDAPRRAKLEIEDSTMPRTLNDDIAYHSFRIALGGEGENAYTARLLAQLTADARRRFESRLAQNNFAYLFLFDRDVPKTWRSVPTLVIAANDDANLNKAVDELLAPLASGAMQLELSDEAIADDDTLKNTPPRDDYGVALINAGTPAASLENPDTLTLFLTHTAPFPGVNLPFEFTPEHKTHVFRYSLQPHSGTWRAARTVRAAADFNNPLIAIETDSHAGRLPAANSFFSIENPNVVLSTLKLSGNPHASFNAPEESTTSDLIARFYDTEGRDSEASFEIFDGFQSMRAVDLLERESVDDATAASSASNVAAMMKRDGKATFTKRIAPFAIETVKLVSSKKFNSNANPSTATDDNREDGKEIVQPVFSRYWMHNAGVAPLGNDAVKILLRPVEQQDSFTAFAYDDKYNQGGTTTIPLRVQIVNNRRERRARGIARLSVPSDWRIVPAEIAYDVAPDSYMTRDIIVTAFPVKQGDAWERASGIVKARLLHDGQEFQDVLEIGKPSLLAWTVEQATNQIIVKVRNPHRYQIEGAVSLIAPLETWADGYATRETAPRETGFAVPPRSEIVLRFPANDASAWTIARLAYNGHVEYLRADDRASVPVDKNR